MLSDAGFNAAQIVDTKKDLNAYVKIQNQSSCCEDGTNNAAQQDTALIRGMVETLAGLDVKQYASSVQVYAMKNVSKDFSHETNGGSHENS